MVVHVEAIDRAEKLAPEHPHSPSSSYVATARGLASCFLLHADSRSDSRVDRGTLLTRAPMRKGTFSTEQIRQPWRQAALGTVVREIYRKLGLTEAP